jgi:hypothetical protein
MKILEKVVFDIAEDRFKYLQRDNEKRSKKVDMHVLNKRLNQSRKINFYTNTKIFAVSLFCFGVIALISLKF